MIIIVIYETAPAKLNLSLDVLRKRKDGFHDVEMVLTTIDLSDRVELQKLNHDDVKVSIDSRYVPDWTFVASEFYLKELYEQAMKNRTGKEDAEPYTNFYGLIEKLVDKGIYSELLLSAYTKDEINHLAKTIDPERDLLFDYLGLYTLATRYLATDFEGNVLELPQERFMIIAMYLMLKEPREKRIALIEEAYWALSNLYMTVATPTLANAGKTHGQLSSCFIDTVDDSLQSIYDSNTDIANLSKNGGGIGVYMGKIRARGSSIKGFKGL